MPEILPKLIDKPPVKLTNQNLGRLVLVTLSFVLQRFALLSNLEALQLVLLFLFSVRHGARLPRTGRTVRLTGRSRTGDVATGGVLGRLYAGFVGN